MSKNKAMVSLFLTVLLTGCMAKPTALPTTEPAQPATTPQTTAGQTTSTTPPQQENQEQIEIVPKSALPQPASIPAKEVPFSYEKMKEDVLIQLDEEPRLHSPITTVVATTPQKYTLFFRQAMDPASVESSIKTNTDMKEDHQASEKRPSFTFAWANDRQLHLIVEVPELQQPEYGHQYTINVKGAKTKKGQVLQEPPTFLAALYTQPQLWRISSDGKRAEQMTNGEEPYYWNQVGLGDDRYGLLFRYTKYCECDANYPKLYAIYDFETDQLTKYPVELMTHYLGEGEFYADTRGFFYHEPAKGVTIPASDTVIKIKVDGFVHGGNFSKNRTHLFLAVGTREQQKDYDLVILELASKKQTRIPKALKGDVPLSELSGSEIGTSFYDDGENVYFIMRSHEEYKEIRYQYNWKTNQVTTWNPPVAPDHWSGFVSSEDRMYQIYWNAGLYKDKERLLEMPFSEHWLGSTHKIVMSIPPENLENAPIKKAGLHLYDVDTGEAKQILQASPHILGTSKDGKWIYLSVIGPFPIK